MEKELFAIDAPDQSLVGKASLRLPKPKIPPPPRIDFSGSHEEWQKSMNQINEVESKRTLILSARKRAKELRLEKIELNKKLKSIKGRAPEVREIRKEIKQKISEINMLRHDILS